MQNKMQGWIGVDLDGTLAEYNGWFGVAHIGHPVPAMVERVKRWVNEGRNVKIFTARCDGGQTALAMGESDGVSCRDVSEAVRHIEEWCVKHLGFKLPVTNVKDYGMIELWDDRAVQIRFNKGEIVGEASQSRFETS